MATAQTRDQIIELVVGMLGTGPSDALFTSLITQSDAGASISDLAADIAASSDFTNMYPVTMTNEQFSAQYANILLSNNVTSSVMADSVTWLTAQLDGGTSRADLMTVVGEAMGDLAADYPDFGAAAVAFQGKVDAYINSLSADPFAITVTDNVARLTGDQAVRIDLTDPNQQIKGLDLDNDGTIENNGFENNITNQPNGFEIVDAYARNPLNEMDSSQNFLGNIYFDGTGFEGNGENTDGNIFLGGLGADAASGGIGNDFMAGGGVAAQRFTTQLDPNGSGALVVTDHVTGQTVPAAVGFDTDDNLFGGRNADFFFVELSLLDPTDGSALDIDGGETADNTSGGNSGGLQFGQSSQDTDWLLLEASDDDEPVHIVLGESNVGGTIDTAFIDNVGGDTGTDDPDADDFIDIDNLENVDASGNLFSFLDGLDARLGANGMVVDGANVGIGSTAQLHIEGNSEVNRLIGGYDNDLIEGNAGNDVLLGGNMRFNNNPNTQSIVNDGMDELLGGAGNDEIVFEMDGGIIDGGTNNDTLWVNDFVGGLQNSSDDLLTDDTIRIDLAAGITASAGYGGADVAGTQDQSNYDASATRVTMNNMENVNATGLGAIDFDVDGGNDAVNDDALSFTNMMNFDELGAVNMDLRGDYAGFTTTTTGTVGYNFDGDVAADFTSDPMSFDGNLSQAQFIAAALGELPAGAIVVTANFTTATTETGGDNLLYASDGNDVLEGRTGDDSLMGGDGNDDFIFSLDYAGSGDDVNVIHRLSDTDGDQFWDGTYEQDFGVNQSQQTGNSSLVINVSELNNPGNELANLTVTQITSVIRDAGGDIAFTLNSADILAANTYAELLSAVQAAIAANPDIATDITATLSGSNELLLTDAQGRELADVLPDAFISVTSNNIQAEFGMDFKEPDVDVAQDRLIFQDYEDRADGEKTDDDSFHGSQIALGSEGYAEDLVIDFAADGTRIAEDQRHALTFSNLTTEDIVTITVNGVEYTLQVGIDLDGNIQADEDGVGESQATIQANFLGRLTAFIDSFMDDDSAAGKVDAALAGSTITLTQVMYDGEETVFMSTPTVEIQNLSGGEPASVVYSNNTDTEVHLLDFDGRDGNLHDGVDATDATAEANVLFLGNTGINRATLETAKNAGSTIDGHSAIVIDGGANDLEATVTNTGATIADNTATNGSLAVNFSAHGDDLLLGGDGADTISGHTGDDRVLGSLGLDTLDGGKNFYAVQVLGETKARVYELNKWEAANPSEVSVLNGLQLVSVTPIVQTETGSSTIAGGIFGDTLQFEQADFTAGVTRFTVTLNDYNINGSTVELQNDGAGTVGIDVDGDGAVDAGQLSTFTNFENVRLVSGVGRAVADSGQGNDTLDISALSGDTGGVSYDLTNDTTGGGPTDSLAGEVRYSTDTIIDLDGPDNIAGNGDDEDRPSEADYESVVLKVDGVEHVIAGSGDDQLLIDETEAAKHNTFDAGNGTDRIEYQDDFGTTTAANPTVTVKVNTSSDTDTVTMTGGRVGTTVAVDTLMGVEFIALGGEVAESSREDDVLDVTSMTTGAVVDYTNGEVRDLNGNVQVTIEGIAELENVWADGDDTVIVADADGMSTMNTRNDNAAPDNTPPKDITFSTFIDFDELATTTRVPFASQNATMITDVDNLAQYTFDLSKTGGGNDSDTVDYSNANDSIAVVVELDEAQAIQYVLVEDDAVIGTFDTTGAGMTAADSRVDALVDVEAVVASQGESILDLTNSTQGLEIQFRAFDVANQTATLDRDAYYVQISDLASSEPLVRNYVEYRDAGLSATTTQATAIWERIEGGDAAEVVVMNSAHSTDNGAFNLRGGDNQIKYNELTRSVTTTLSVTDFDGTSSVTALASGLINASTVFQDGSGGGLIGSGTHVTTSYTADNAIAAGSLKIAASQDAEDTLKFSGTTDKLFVLGEAGTTDNQITVKIGQATANNSVVLTGYEFLQDFGSDDVYEMGLLANVMGNLTLTDDHATSSADHDTIKVGNDAITFNGAAANTIGLNNLSATVGGFNFDFDVLDVTGVTSGSLILVGGTNLAPTNILLEDATDGTDEVVLGALSQVASITSFEAMVLTEASIAAGNTFTFNTTANTLVQGGTTVSTTADNLSFGGTLLETSLRNGNVADATTGVTVNVVGAAAIVRGGDGDDIITGGGGADTLHGNGGADTLDGGTAAEVREIQLDGILDGLAGGTVVATLSGFSGAITTVTEGAEIVVGAGSDAVGTALATKMMANLTAINTGAAWSSGGSLVNVSYDTTTDLMTFTFNTGVDIADAVSIADTDASVTFNASGETTPTQGGDGGVDTFVFEATAALNGVDTLNNFVATDTVADDLLDFTAFTGATTADAAGDVDGGAGDMTLSGGENVGLFFNKGTLAASDVKLAADATVADGEVLVLDNSKSVVLTTADVNGTADATNNAYNVYYVEDTDLGTGVGEQSFAVTLVGTINSTTELNAADFFGTTDAFV
jgi:hypothetical protein